MSWMMAPFALLLAIAVAACSPMALGGEQAGSAEKPKIAAPVPTLVLTEAHAGKPQVAEAGDRVEVHLSEAGDDGKGWVLRKSGDALTLVDERVESKPHEGDHLLPERVFRFTSAGAGRSELVFVRSGRALTFVVELR